MNQIKKILGIVWILLGPVAAYYLFDTAMREIEQHPSVDTTIQWSVFVIVFLPIAAGLCIFGWYAFKGEYHHLPQSSGELDAE